MTTGGWIIMLIAVTSVSVLFVCCMVKVMATPETSHLNETMDEAPDRDEESV